jgi:hypothetical protein
MSCSAPSSARCRATSSARATADRGGRERRVGVADEGGGGDADRGLPLEDRGDDPLEVGEQRLEGGGHRRSEVGEHPLGRQLDELLLGVGVAVDVGVCDPRLGRDLAHRDLRTRAGEHEPRGRLDEVVEPSRALVARAARPVGPLPVPLEDLRSPPQHRAAAGRGEVRLREVRVAASVGGHAVAVRQPEDLRRGQCVDQVVGGIGGHRASLLNRLTSSGRLVAAG